MKNKSLLRRGQFETPIPNEICGKSFENNALKTQKT